MMCHPNVPVDTVQFKFIPFALKDDAKKGMYALFANSIANWIDLCQSFCENTSPIVK